MNVIRASIPDPTTGDFYNVLTDTNLDHFSLYTDQDNILIKEKERNTITFSSGTQTIAHNLGYIPDFKVYVNDQASAFVRYGWKSVAAQNSAFVVNNFYAYADTTNLYITNNSGLSTTFIYYIFYDNQVGSSGVTIDESPMLIKIAKTGVDALVSRDPNDYIFHSDLNTFKVLKEGNASITYTSDGEYTINHGLSLTNPTSFDLFLEFPDGYTVKCAGENLVFSRDQQFTVQDAILTTTQLKFTLDRISGSGTAINAKYYTYETPLTGSSGILINPIDHLIRVAKSGFSALTERDPNNYRFLSGYNTLKYLPTGVGNQSITIVGDTTLKSTEITVPHNLGYVPYFTCFVDDFVSFANTRFALAPFRNETLTLLRKSEVYADSTNLYIKMFNKSSSTYTGKFYYKIYKNNLGL